jgi:hypothetical protein
MIEAGAFLNTHGIKHFNDIAVFLDSADKPLPETTVLRYAFDLKEIPSNNRELYEKHFLLFHSLYMIKKTWGYQGYYLYLHPLRIRLLKIGKGCSYYYADSGEFCDEPLINGVCPFHHDTVKTSFPEYDCLEGFYGDLSNIEWDQFQNIEKIRKGILFYSFRMSEVKKALIFMGFSGIPSGFEIRKRYRELAGQYHPDRSGGNIEKMKTLNEGYALLKNVFIV